ncbi:MAG: aminotransferase class I/II-fold pyridoxal phosphate-dependent enzyme [Gaiellaceae bacterium]
MTDVRSLRFHGDELVRPGVLDFAVNVWRAPRSRKLRNAMADALEDHDYPKELPARMAIAHRTNRPVEEILLLNGAAEGFWLLAGALRPTHAVCVHPMFTEPEAALRASGAKVTRAFRNRETFRLEVDAVPEEADFVVLSNPNNPTGNLDRAVEIEKLARPGRTLVVDEAFMDFARSSRESMLKRRDLSEQGVVVVRSFTKLWGVAGVRAGYLTASPQVVERLTANRQPWSVNAVACAAIRVCANDRTTRKQVARQVVLARSIVERALGELPTIRVWPSVANFVLIETPHGARVVGELQARGIAVRPAAGFPGLTENHVRLAVRATHENEELLAAIRDAVDL